MWISTLLPMIPFVFMPAQGGPPRPMALKAARLIVLSLAMGLGLFLAVVTTLRLTGNLEVDSDVGTLLAWVAHGFAVMMVVPLTILRSRFKKIIQQQQESVRADSQKGLVPAPVVTMTIVSAAVYEGVGLLATVSLLVGAPWWAAVLPLFCILVILLMAPSRSAIEAAAR